jgi:hypothetical protein
MKPEQIFDLATKQDGGRLLERSSLINSLVERFKSLLVSYSKDDKLIKAFPSIYVDFVDNSTFNAFAFKYYDKYIIGIHEGVVLILNDLFKRMLSHKNILSDVGDSSNELEDKSIEGYFDNIDDMVVFGHNGRYIFLEPKDITRRQFASHLTTIALTFIFEHELSHILFGHVDFLNEKYGLNRLSEIQGDDSPLLRNLDLQTMEMDADCTSIARCCNLAINVVNKPSRIHPDYHKFYSNIYSSFSDINFAICNVLLLFGDGNYKDTTIGKNSHPDPRIRQLMATATFESISKQWDELEIDYNRLKDLLLKGVKDANLAYEYLTGNKINKDVFKLEYYAHHPLVQAVLDNWKYSIREKLEKHTFKPLTP